MISAATLIAPKGRRLGAPSGGLACCGIGSVRRPAGAGRGGVGVAAVKGVNPPPRGVEDGTEDGMPSALMLLVLCTSAAGTGVAATRPA